MKKKVLTLIIAAAQLAAMTGGLTAFAQDDALIADFEKIRTETLPELDSLIKECEDKKIFVDYEKSNYLVIEKFIDIGINDASDVHVTANDRGLTTFAGYGDETKPNDKTARARYIYDSITEIADNTKTALESYLNNTTSPVGNVPVYNTSTVTTDGFSFVASDENGEQTPVFFTGYGHFFEAVRDIPIFAEMGVNIIQIEAGISRIVFLDENGEMYFDENSDYVKGLINAFDEAEKYNVGISLLLSPHYMPKWVTEKYGDKIYGSYFSANDEMRGVLKFYIENMMRIFGDKPALQSICITNEPGRRATNETYELPMYREHLKTKYNNDIQELNNIHGTSYSSFDEIKFPDFSTIYNPVENIDVMPAMWDYIDFNDQNFSDIHEYMYNVIHECNPDVLVGIKVMQDYDCDERDWRRDFILRGTDVERIAEYLTINGNDANNYYDPQDYQWDIMNKMSFYDLQASIRKAPVFDFENHVIRDRDTSYGEEIMVNHVAADTWQGAIHGRGGSAIWIWERSYNDSHDFAGSILNRPDVVAENSKTMLDLHRLVDEVTALENTERRIGILYSRTARLYSKYNSNALTNIYEASTYTGERVEFVTENQAIEGKLNKCDVEVLVVPYSTHLKKGTAEAVADFIRKGGKVIVVGDESFAGDQYNLPTDAETRSYILSNSTVIDERLEGDDQLSEEVLTDVWNSLLGYFGNRGVKLVDAVNGEPMFGVSYTYTMENGAVLVNICNYDYDNVKNAKVMYNGSPVGQAIELRSMNKISCDNITLNSVEPILMRFENGLFTDIEDHWSTLSVKSLWERDLIGSNTLYSPESTITVSQFATMIRDAFGVKIDGGEALLTREAMAEMMVEVCRQRKNELVSGDINAFADADKVTNKDAMGYAVGMGIISGTPDMMLLPGDNATMAQAAAVISRVLGE